MEKELLKKAFEAGESYQMSLEFGNYAETFEMWYESQSKLKNLGDIGHVSERVQRIAVYFAEKNPTPTKWANDILKYILEGSKHDR